ncbi:copper amine oxidase N-terminal domain-containing protein [Paenibacillus sp. FSL R10-2736]|uniref:copper amine oxidase N-terminal domain-containing protein n=1 Tax=Paenibacillus sp. FSL R10-2736 TaxID=2954692 RepID=UPI0030F786F8
MILFKIKIPAVALLATALIGTAPLTASAPISASAAATVSAKASDSIKVQSMNVKMLFDGVSIQPPIGQHVFIYNNTTYVPIRFVSYALQKSVSWDAKNLKVTVAEPTSSELVIIKEYLMNAGNANSETTAVTNIALNKVLASYVFNGSAKAVPTGQASYMLNGSMYVPLRFLSESVGNKIIWDQKTKTITAASASYQEQAGNIVGGNAGNTKDVTSASPTANPAPTGGATSGGGSAGAGAITYEQITSRAQAKLTALQSQSRSTLTSLAVQYLSETDNKTKASILAKGKQQLASFTASFNSIIADVEKQLTTNGYPTDIISEYRATFEADLEDGKSIAEAMGN